MKTIISKLIVFLASVTLLVTITDAQPPEAKQPEQSLLDLYKQQSSYTDPGEYKHLYKDLPDALPELCSIVRSQYINPYVHRDQVPRERMMEGLKYLTVKSALKGLLSYDPSGLTKDRKTEDRLVLICRDNAVLLASILRNRGIPVRVRYGYAPYLIPGFHTGHVICEVWNGNDKRWMLVDPSTDMVDFDRDQFDFSNDVWKKMQNKEIDPNLYGMPGRMTGLVMITSIAYKDLASILGNEHCTYQYAPIMENAFKNHGQYTLGANQTETLTRISELMTSIDADNISKLQRIYNDNPQIQLTKLYDPRRGHSGNRTGGPEKTKPGTENNAGK